MTTLVFVLFWVILGLGLLIIALSGGPSGALSRMQSQSRGSRKFAAVGFVIALLVLGAGVPAAVISLIDHRNDIPTANVSNLTAAEKLPVEDGWADVVISNGVINLCADKRAVFDEIRRNQAMRRMNG